MGPQASTGPPGRDEAGHTFLRAPSPDDPLIGGKGRSLARLSALGLPVPPALVVTTELGEALRASGAVAVPAAEPIDSPKALAALAATRRRWLAVAFPPGFDEALEAALRRLAGEGTRALEAGDGGARAEVRFAVRSSSTTEDDEGALAPGVFASVLDVPRAEVGAAIRRVLASAYTPAAWQYLTPSRAGDGDAPMMAVLIHPYLPGEGRGAVAWGPAAQGQPPLVAVERGSLDPGLRPQLLDAAERAGRVHGSVELEWVAAAGRIVFLQMRPFHRGGADAGDGATPLPSGGPWPGEPWRWDAAHNPLPLSPSQAGLVAFVDERAGLPIEQRVVEGYLFWRPRAPVAKEDHGGGPVATAIEGSVPPAGDEEIFTRASFDALVARTQEELIELTKLTEAPALEAALDLFARAYAPLFGEVAPACARARRTLFATLDRLMGPEAAAARPWLANVPSAATRRGRAARALARAKDDETRDRALAQYLEEFGEESPRWDVAEPTWRETPQRLLWLLGVGATEEGDEPGRVTAEAPRADDETSDARAEDEGQDEGGDPRASVLSGETAAASTTIPDAPSGAEASAALLPEGAKAEDEAELARCVAAAREAAAVMEDDDVFYASLQALLRRALLGVGRALVARGELGAAADVFFLPLTRVRAVAAGLDGAGPPLAAVPPASCASPAPGAPEESLAALAAAGRELWDWQRLHPPPATTAIWARPDATMATMATSSRRGHLRGQGGSPGQAVGRAVHHPASVPVAGGTILIAATLLPAELPLLAPAGIVAETGSPLGHVAAQARERCIPAVVGAADARARIPEGALVVVDGERGEVSWTFPAETPDPK